MPRRYLPTSQNPQLAKKVFIFLNTFIKIKTYIKSETDQTVHANLRHQHKILRDSITNEKRKNKKLHLAQKFLENKDNSSKIWKEIRSLVNKSSSITILDENEKITSDSDKIANIFNEHHATLGSKVQQKIPTQEGDYNFYLDERDKNGKRYINPDGYTFYLSRLDLLRLKKLMTKLR